MKLIRLGINKYVFKVEFNGRECLFGGTKKFIIESLNEAFGEENE